MKQDLKQDLSVTALYTCGTWAWARLPGAELLAHVDAERVFGATNAALAVARPFFAAPPSLKHSLVQRHVMIDRVLAEANAEVVLELAAGLSPRGVRVSADPRVRYIEVDRAHVVARKRELLARSEAGQATLARPNLDFVAGDVAEVDLAALAGPGTSRLCVIAEGLLMYLDAAAQLALWTRLRRLFDARDGVLVFDLVPAIEQPRPGSMGRALEWTMKRFTGGQAFERDLRTRTDIAHALASVGFTVEVLAPADVATRWQLPFTSERTQQLLFVARPVR